MAQPGKVGRSRSTGRRPLYPGWGTGNLPFVGNFLVRNVTECGRSELEIGDKMILPETCLSDISRLRLPFPLIFEIRSLKRSSKIGLSRSLSKGLSKLDDSVVSEYRKRIRAVYSAKNPAKLSDVEYLLQKYHRDLHTLYANVCQKYSVPVRDPMDRYAEKCAASLSGSSSTKKKKSVQSSSVVFRQFGSVQEFSAPPRTAYLPGWMMQNLQLKSGDPVEVESQFDLAKGTYALLEPCDPCFLDSVSSVGVREILENSLRCYSTLSIDERLLVEFDGRRWDLIVRDLKPSFVVSILGSTDLSVDFKVNEEHNPAQKTVVSKKDDTAKSDWFPDWCEVDKTESSGMVDDQSHFDDSHECKEDGIHSLPPATAVVPPVTADLLPTLHSDGTTTDVVAILKRLDIPLEFELQESLRCTLEKEVSVIEESALESELSDCMAASLDLKLTSEEEKKNESQKECSEQTPLVLPGPDEVICEHCGKVISKMCELMHTMHCVKKFVKCEHCSVMVNRSVFEEHQKEYHIDMECPLCGESFKGSLALSQHETQECPLRMVSCFYCQRTDIVAQDSEEHSMRCKKESVDCDQCGESLMRIFLSNHVCRKQCPLGCDCMIRDSHIRLHCVSDECSKRVAQCPFCKMIRVVINPDWEEHLSYCGSRSEKCEQCSKWVKLSDMTRHLGSLCKEFANNNTAKKRRKKKKETDEHSTMMKIMSDDSLIQEETAPSSILSSFAQSAEGLRPSSLAAFTGQSDDSAQLDPTKVQSVRQSVLCPHCQFDYHCRDSVEFQTHICTNHPEMIDDPRTKKVLKSMYKSEVSSISQAYAYPHCATVSRPSKLKSKSPKHSRVQREPWACSTCTFENDWDAGNCQLCGAGKS